jgi:hypothetical protein
MNAARKVRQYLHDGGSVQDLMSAARRLIFLKGDNARDYKFSAAVLEDYFNVSPAWRAQFLATSVFNLRQRRPRQCTGGADPRGAESLNGEGPIEPLA